MSDTTRVLVVAHKTAATPALLEAVRERAAAGPTTFTLLVPKAVHGLDRVADPEDVTQDEAHAMLELALPLLEDAAGGPVEGIVGDASPITAIADALNAADYDEIILSTLPTRVSKWLHIDVPSKAKGFGLPVTTITAKERAAAAPAG